MELTLEQANTIERLKNDLCVLSHLAAIMGHAENAQRIDAVAEYTRVISTRITISME
jgi:hypothetical protein